MKESPSFHFSQSPANTRVPSTSRQPFATLVLEATYEATLLEAVLDSGKGQSNIVLLTFLGGGAFGNEDAWIRAAIEYALKRVSRYSLDILIVSYRQPSHELFTSAAFSTDGRRIVTASRDKTARVWDAETRKPLCEPLRHKGSVRSAAFSPDGRRIVTASDDKTARVWDAETGKPLSEPLRHEATVWSAAFSPDGRRIVTASDDKAARVWEVFPMHQGLVDEAKAITPVCLTAKQRGRYYLSPEPPDWCITGSGNGLDAETDPGRWQPKWPYHTGAWKNWLIDRRAGKNPPLPTD